MRTYFSETLTNNRFLMIFFIYNILNILKVNMSRSLVCVIVFAKFLLIFCIYNELLKCIKDYPFLFLHFGLYNIFQQNQSIQTLPKSTTSQKNSRLSLYSQYSILNILKSYFLPHFFSFNCLLFLLIKWSPTDRNSAFLNSFYMRHVKLWHFSLLAAFTIFRHQWCASFCSEVLLRL
jgi:hypothetical protein